MDSEGDVMGNETATEILMRDQFRVDLRRRRAEALASAVLQKINGFLAEEDRKDTYCALMELFLGSGVEVLTDEDRRQAGLPSRDDYGWTPQELSALELARLETMVKPLSMTFPPRAPATTEGDRGD